MREVPLKQKKRTCTARFDLVARHIYRNNLKHGKNLYCNQLQASKWIYAGLVVKNARERLLKGL